MRTAGIREARQNLSMLIEQVKNGREVTITERGKPVAILSRPRQPKRKGLPDLTKFWRSLGAVSPLASDRLVEIVEEDRNDRL
jgi:antitoxin (DNA-binding transcriptional repressor) of toxin-antitoxin stability system